MYTVDTYQDEDSGLWGYIIYDDGKPVITSNAIYSSSAEANRAATYKLAV